MSPFYHSCTFSKRQSAASGSSGFLFLSCSWLLNCAWNDEEVLPNTTIVNYNTLGSSFCFKNLSILWYRWSIEQILRDIFAILHTRAIGYLWNIRSTLIKSCLSFGLGWMIWFNNFPSHFTEPFVRANDWIV